MLDRIRRRWDATGHRTPVRLCLSVLGCVLIVASPLVGALPGPGGIFVFAAGLGLILRNSIRARRHYVVFKRRWPRQGRWADWGLRRASARRRAEIEKAQARATD